MGVIGSGNSLKYTSLGDTVNTASRLESFEKDDYRLESRESCWRILIGDETREYIGNEFEVVDLGERPLRGKSNEIRIHRVLGESLGDIAKGEHS